MYGSRTNNEGQAITANGVSPILTGEQVVGNTITSLAMAEDANGNTADNRAVLTFTQSNGAKFNHSFWNSSEEWAIDQVNREMLHICTKIVSEEDYYSLIDQHGDGTFTGFISVVSNHILPKAEGKTFTLKIVYKENKSNGKHFPNFPKYPNFIEVDGTKPSTLSTNPKYDIYVMPTPTNMSEFSTESSDTSSVVF